MIKLITIAAATLAISTNAVMAETNVNLDSTGHRQGCSTLNI